jgi:homoserine kinase type II
VVLPPGFPAPVLELLGLRPRRLTGISDVPRGNANWLVETGAGERCVLRRYAAAVTRPELAYEHAVLSHLAAVGWTVPAPLGEPVSWQERWYGLTRYVPGAAVTAEDAAQQARRGGDLARLHLALQGLYERIGQRPGWQPQHRGSAVRTGAGWDECVRGLAEVSPRLASWVQAASAQTQAALDALGADDLPLLVVHGDFAEWNVHYEGGQLAGVLDFALAHGDSRPYELAIARAYRAPGFAAAYRTGLAVAGWPLTQLEEAAVVPVYHAFRVGMAAAELDGLVTGPYDLAMIERQLSRSGTVPP